MSQSLFAAIRAAWIRSQLSFQDAAAPLWAPQRMRMSWHGAGVARRDLPGADSVLPRGASGFPGHAHRRWTTRRELRLPARNLGRPRGRL